MNDRLSRTIKRRMEKKKTSARPRKVTSPKTNVSATSKILHLQRTIGNRAVTKLIESGQLQAKLKISSPNDKYERKADREAGSVMRMPEASIQRKCQGCEEEEIQTKRTSHNNTETTPSTASQISSLRVGGQPLSQAERSFFEPRFGSDFGDVRLHTDSRAAQAAQGVNAKAFTLGRDVVFGNGQYSPNTEAGKGLLAHELTHTLQQSGEDSIIYRWPVDEDWIMCSRFWRFMDTIYDQGHLDTDTLPEGVDAFPDCESAREVTPLAINPWVTGFSQTPGTGGQPVPIQGLPPAFQAGGAGAGTATAATAAAASPLAAPAICLAILLYGRPTQEQWLNSRNPVTQDYYQTREEHNYIRALSPEQVEYLGPLYSQQPYSQFSPYVETSEGDEPEQQRCRSRADPPCPIPLPITWPVELPLPPRNRWPLERISSSEREAEGEDNRTNLQQELHNWGSVDQDPWPVTFSRFWTTDQANVRARGVEIRFSRWSGNVAIQ